MFDKPDIKAIIFDLGGVLLRTDDPQPRTALAERLGLTRWKLEEIVFNNPLSQQAERGLVTSEEVWAAVAAELHLPEEQIPTIRREFFGGDKVDFAFIETIQRLRATYTTAMLSNTWIVDLPGFLRDNLQIPDTFDYVISSAQQQMAKPDPQIFKLALQMVNAQAEEAIFVDDNDQNIAAAAALGIHTIRFRSADQARKELLALVQMPQ